MNSFLKFCPGDAFLLLTANVLLQIAAVVALAFAIALVFARHRAAVRHAIWLSALVCVLLSPAAAYLAAKSNTPLLSLRLLPRCTANDVEMIVAAAPVVADTEKLPDMARNQFPSPVVEATNQFPSPVVRGTNQLRAPLARGEEPAIVLSDANSPHPSPLPKGEGIGGGDRWRAMLGLAVVLWAGGAVVLFVRLLHGCRHIARLRRRLQPIGGQRLAILNEVRRALNAQSLPRLAMLPRTIELAGPITIGLFRPVVVLPEKLLEMLEADRLRDVLVHEFAHAVRRDPLVGFVQRLAAVVYWPYPPVHFLNRRLAWSREEVCDNYVLRQGDAPGYAETLLAISQRFFSKRAQPAALGLFHPYGRLEQRVADLLNPRRNVMVRTHRGTSLILAAMFAAAVVVVACTRLLQAEPPAAPAAADVAPAEAKPSLERPTVNEPIKRYSDVATIDYSGQPIGGDRSVLLSAGYTVVTISDENAPTTKVAVSFAWEPGAPSAGSFRVVAKDQQKTMHEPVSTNIAVGGGGNVHFITIICKFSLRQNAIAELLVVRQTKDLAVSLPAYRVEAPDILMITMSPSTPKAELAASYNAASVTGQYLVGPDGTINLRQYGVLNVAGKTPAEIRAVLNKHLSRYFHSPDASVHVAQFNSKVFYVIAEGSGMGDNVRRVPITGNETVRDALKTIKDLPQASNAKVWVARPLPSPVGSEQILLVDYAAITRGASAATNYQIMPGDRVFVMTKPEGQVTPSPPAAPAGAELPGLPSEQAVVAPAEPKPAVKGQATRKPAERYSDVVTLDYSGGGPGGNGFVRLPTGYTVLTISNENASTIEVAVSFACEQTTPSPKNFRIVAKDKQNKLYEPVDENSVMGGGAKVRVTTIVAKFSLPQKDLAKLVVQQSGEVASQPMPAREQTRANRGYRTTPATKQLDTGFQIPPSGPLVVAPLNVIQPLDVLRINAMGTIPDKPIDGYYLVEPDGQVPLGPAYGRADVKGLTWEQAEGKIVEQLKKVLVNPTVQVTLGMRSPRWREAVLAKASHKIGVWDVLQVRVRNTMPDQPIDSYFLVEPTGTLALGPAYGRVQVKGLTLEAAETAIHKKLQEVLTKPEVQVTLARSADQKEQWREIAPPKAPYAISSGALLYIRASGTIRDQPIDGTYTVEPTGTVALGPAYGRVEVKGLTLEAAEKAIQNKLRELLTNPAVQVTFAGWKNDAGLPLVGRADEKPKEPNEEKQRNTAPRR